MLTITEIEFFPDVVSEDVTISTIDVGEQMIAIGEVNFDWSHGSLSWVLCASRHAWRLEQKERGLSAHSLLLKNV